MKIWRGRYRFQHERTIDTRRAGVRHILSLARNDSAPYSAHISPRVNGISTHTRLILLHKLKSEVGDAYGVK